MKTFSILTLGCRVNQYDSEVLRELGEKEGYLPASDRKQADLVILDACTVTQGADGEVGRLLRRARKQNPKAILALVGCLPPNVSFSEADWILPGRKKFSLFERLAGRNGEPDSHWPQSLTRFEGHRRPILKVQDGCRFQCAFCAVPAVRGGILSRPLDLILAEARDLAATGAKEVVLAGIQLSSYGMDQGKKSADPRLEPVIRALLEIPGLKRVRLSSYGVSDFEEQLRPLFREGTLCPHLHLPLQSGDEGILKAMKRPYTLDKFRSLVSGLRGEIPEMGLTTDLIAGFPGETDEAFENTLRRIREFGFQDFHPFPYSERPGTAAQSMGPKVSDAIVKSRMERLLSLKRELLKETFEVWRDRVVEVVAENHSPAYYGATTQSGVKLWVPRQGEFLGKEIRVRITDLQNGQILAVQVE